MKQIPRKFGSSRDQIGALALAAAISTIVVTVIFGLNQLSKIQLMGRPPTDQQFSTLKSALSLFKRINGRYPTNKEGLEALTNRPPDSDLSAWEQCMQVIPLDNWGETLSIQQPANAQQNDPRHFFSRPRR